MCDFVAAWEESPWLLPADDVPRKFLKTVSSEQSWYPSVS